MSQMLLLPPLSLNDDEPIIHTQAARLLIASKILMFVLESAIGGNTTMVYK